MRRPPPICAPPAVHPSGDVKRTTWRARRQNLKSAKFICHVTHGARRPILRRPPRLKIFDSGDVFLPESIFQFVYSFYLFLVSFRSSLFLVFAFYIQALVCLYKAQVFIIFIYAFCEPLRGRPEFILRVFPSFRYDLIALLFLARGRR